MKLKSFCNRATVILVTLLLVAAAASTSATAQTLTTLHTFDGTDGAQPLDAMVQGTDGQLYGTAWAGGGGNGTVFKITPSGAFTILHLFSGADGHSPWSGPLLLTADGSFYGSTVQGGDNSYDCLSGCGTLYKMTSSGTLTTVYSFCAQSGCTDGAWPTGGVIQAPDGNFYGTTEYGGTGLVCAFAYAPGCGTIFKMTPSGALTTLYNFCSQTQIACPDGVGPLAGLTLASNNKLYGTTGYGGYENVGTVFAIAPDGSSAGTLYSFCSRNGCTDGAYPYGGSLLQAADGNLYGTTSAGGVSTPPCLAWGTGCGTIFKITPRGKLTTLHRFCSKKACVDGKEPLAGLIQATDGNFYGVTEYGGANGGGTIFKLTPSGTLTTLYAFCSQSGCMDGEYPYGGLVQATDGDLYGTNGAGGAYNYGTIFRLSVGLGPFVTTMPTAAKVGAPVKILGTDLTGASSVTFNGTASTFTVVSSSEITTTVPASAMSGTVQVTTPAGVLTSNQSFRVRP